MQRDQAVIDRWSGAAPYWEKHRESIRQMFAPVTQALIEDARIDNGLAVLDVATGPGEPALGIAPVVGPGGRIVGIDPIPEMVAAARRSANRSGFPNTQFEVAFADDLPFAADSFDAVVSRFGIMFAPSPGDAVREMLRVLKPGRKLALAVWHVAESNPFFHALSRVIAQYLDSPPPQPDAPDAFRFAASGKLRKILSDAGAIGSSERLLRFTIEAQLSAEEFWALRTEMSDSLRQKIASLSPEQLREAKREVLEAMGEYSTTHGMSFPGEVLIVSATKSGPLVA
jgi:ubiquinone/menaquinone biosynthesis C-methylase UbiE